MIFTDRTIMVKNGTSSINDTIVLYRGDREVEIRFTLNEGTPFKFGSGASPNIIEKTEATYGQLVIKTPGALPPIFSEVTPTIGGKIIFTITAEMIDETTEVGNYTFQIRLLDDNMESRATLPEVKNGIEIREPIALEDVSTSNEVGVATVGYAMTTSDTPQDAFDAQGNYNKTTWATGDRITAAKLNKFEAAIDGVNKKVASGGTGSTEASGVSIQDIANNFTATNVEGALTELFQSVSNGKSLIASAITDKGVGTSNTDTFETMSNNIKLIEGGAVETSPYETINGQLYRVILNEDFKTKDYLNANIFADCYGITSWTDNPGRCRANYKIEDGLLKLIINEDTQLWAPDSKNKASGICTVKRNGLHPNTDDRLALYNSSTPYRNYTEKFLGFIMQYGRVEIKCKIPYGKNHMSAFWLLGVQDNIEQTGEIDIFETSTGRSETTTIGTIHTWYDKSIGTGSNTYYTYEYDVDSDMSANFHIYAVEWDETGIEIYVDGVKKIGKDKIGWNKNMAYPMMILLDHYATTVENKWGSNGNNATLPCSFDIEYIKAYKKATSEETLLSIISQDECSFTINEYSDDLINADYEIKGMPSYVSLNWNDGVKTEHWVKWQPITDDMKEQYKTAGNYTLIGTIPGLNYNPTMTLTVQADQGSTSDYIAPLTPDENGLLIDFDFTNLASGTEYVTSKNNSLLKAKVIGGTCETDGIQLDGVDDYIELRCKPFVNKDIEDMTVIIEFTADDTQDGLDTFFECCNNAEPYGGIQCRWTGTDMGWYFATGHTPYNTVEMSNSTSNAFGNTPTTVPKTSVKMTRSSSGELKFTMDDTVTKSCTNSNIVAKPFIWDGLFYIGCNMQVSGVPRRFAKMKVKSIKMYNKVV